MRARAVIGANFGDEGKGLVTDWLCSTQGADAVVRFNGGAQAGHTVVCGPSIRHVFSHFGSGTFASVPTFLSEYFICNPILFMKELDALQVIGVDPVVFVSPKARVTTFADMIINQTLEDARDKSRHGSCGLGIGETVDRSSIPHLTITMADLWNRVNLDDRLKEICGNYAEFRTGKRLPNPDAMITEFKRRCEHFASLTHPAGMGDIKEPIFEGAQGLLLDQNNKEFFPHVTHSCTTAHNVRVLCAQAGIDDLELYYVSRTYLTRHGAGLLPGEDAKLSYRDDTNTDHPYQGQIRFAPLDDGLAKRCAKDANSNTWHLFLTHCDQQEPSDHAHASFHSFGPTRDDVEID